MEVSFVKDIEKDLFGFVNFYEDLDNDLYIEIYYPELNKSKLINEYYYKTKIRNITLEEKYYKLKKNAEKYYGEEIQIKNKEYLTDMPLIFQDYGIPKVLLVRKEIIHIKHIFTEVFTRKTIDINGLLQAINWDLFRYMEYMTNKIRKIHYIPREISLNPNLIIKSDNKNIYDAAKFYAETFPYLVFDHDTTIANNEFKRHYRKLVKSFHSTAAISYTLDLLKYRKVNNEDKISAIRYLIEECKNKYPCFVISSDEEILTYSWVFGLKTYYWNNEKKKIKQFTLKSK